MPSVIAQDLSVRMPSSLRVSVTSLALYASAKVLAPDKALLRIGRAARTSQTALRRKA